ncbi:DUF4307 domain-containing protein [Krasilnikoviella flava]|uniref:DUF4307 domain-containing protein n=1 Tax=Krasilnikoviella flava TaxID=526729 RepID=A0A1T5ICC0_9MICO|nr:DUF4307 domain-containing protein [Krasilnikoviella flava]SKC36673.1 protein of unknown function [Krasilnikoviella flava]
MSEPVSPTPPADRYGTHQGRRGLGTGAKVAIGAVLAAAVAVAAWFSVEQNRRDPVTVDVVGFDVRDAEQVDVTFQVHMPPGTTAVCEVEALAQSYAQVGTLEVPVGPSDKQTSTYTVTLRTSEEATTAVVESCDVPDPS